MTCQPSTPDDRHMTIKAATTLSMIPSGKGPARRWYRVEPAQRLEPGHYRALLNHKRLVATIEEASCGSEGVSR